MTMAEFVGSDLQNNLTFVLFAFMGIMMGSIAIVGTVADWRDRRRSRNSGGR